MSQPPDQKPPPPRSLLGSIALIVLGLVILIPSGLCTAVMGVAAIGSMFSKFGGIEAGISGLVGTLVLSGPFIVAGVFLIHAGWRRRDPK
jgi:hypothetical protein